jgi:hypothetical protein
MGHQSARPAPSGPFHFDWATDQGGLVGELRPGQGFVFLHFGGEWQKSSNPSHRVNLGPCRFFLVGCSSTAFGWPSRFARQRKGQGCRCASTKYSTVPLGRAEVHDTTCWTLQRNEKREAGRTKKKKKKKKKKRQTGSSRLCSRTCLHCLAIKPSLGKTQETPSQT